jgi:hypothetical protein
MDVSLKAIVVDRVECTYTNDGDVLDVVLEAGWLGIGIFLGHFGRARKLDQLSGTFKVFEKFEDVG